jgi:ketosteroid isomerase-like protein
MRSSRSAALLAISSTLAVACGGEEPAPQPPPPPPAVSASASASPAPPVVPPPPKPSLAELIPQTLKGIGEAFNAHDAKKLASFYTDDCTVDDYGTPEAHGPDDVAKGLQMLFDGFGDAKTAPLRVWIKGNVAISEFVWQATMTGDMMILKASKKPVGQIRVHVSWFNDDGRVKEEHDYGDQAGLIAQMTGRKGAPPVPAIPTNPPDVHLAKGTPDEDKLADWAKGISDLFNKDDPKAIVGQVATDADNWINFTGAPAAKGINEITKDLAGWFKAFPDQKWSSSNAWGIDGFAIIEHTVTGTQKGPLGTLVASNKPVANWHWIDVWQAGSDGKIQHSWGYANLLELQLQTGAFKLPIGKAAGKESGPKATPAPTAASATTVKEPAPKAAPAAVTPKTGGTQ